MPSPGGQGISKSAAGIGEAQHRGAAFPDSELASGVNARRRRAMADHLRGRTGPP
jgi:hypothetical protein